VTNYVVIPIRYAARFMRDPSFDPFADMRPSEALLCRRMMHQRMKADEALARWETRDIDNTKD
jgi:hypothetical protein